VRQIRAEVPAATIEPCAVVMTGITIRRDETDVLPESNEISYQALSRGKTPHRTINASESRYSTMQILPIKLALEMTVCYKTNIVADFRPRYRKIAI
jgi:hypothetical protein